MNARTPARVVLVSALCVLLLFLAVTAGLPMLYLLLAWAGVGGG